MLIDARDVVPQVGSAVTTSMLRDILSFVNISETGT